MKVYIVMYSDGEDRNVDSVFTSLKLAQNYIEQQNNWKPAFKKKFGVSYDDVETITWKMQDWLYDNDIIDQYIYYIIERELYDN